MLLCLTTLTPQNEFRKFSLYIDRLEFGFDVLNRIVAKGNKLLRVQLADDQGIVNLPVEAFDGSSILESIKELENEWKFIMESSPNSEANTRMAISTLIKRQLVVYKNQIERIEPLLKRTEALLLRSKEMNLSPHNQALVNSFQRSLTSYQNQLDRAYHNRQRLQQTIDNSL